MGCRLHLRRRQGAESPRQVSARQRDACGGGAGTLFGRSGEATGVIQRRGESCRLSRRPPCWSRRARELLDVSECEQRRLRRDLHDGLCQELTGLAFLIHSMQQRPEPAGRMRANEVAELTTLIRTALK